jgi:hypothetical protein
MATVRLSTEQVTRLADLLTVVAGAAGTSDEDRYELRYCRSQVGELMPGIEVLVLAGVLAELTDRPGPDPAARRECRWWSAHLARLLSAASAVTAAALGQQPSSFIRPGPPALRWSA